MKHQLDPSTREFDVAIVGGGPTGVALANLLAMQGVSVLVAERHAGVLPIPRAVHIDGETMRVFQSMGLAADLLAVLRPGSRMEWVDASGETLLVRLGLEGLGPQGWHNDYYFNQPELEAVLRRGLARFDTVHVGERLEVRRHREDATGVTLEAHDLGRDEPCEIRCRWVVGCDGARSIVRTWIGDEHEDLGSHQGWLVVDGVLEHPLDLPEHTVQHCDPARPSTSIHVSPLRRRWELMLLPDDDPATIIQPQRVWELLSRWVQPTQARLERATTYTFHSLVARHWQRGRLAIAGDAAHQTPPFLGQGLCAGIRDAANLAWKLAAAVRSPQSGERLLATYGPERTPHAREFVALAVEVGKVIQITDPAAAAQRDARLKAQGMRFTFPTPKLGPGLHRPGHDANGRVFMQGVLPDGQWSDDRIGHRFALLVNAHLEPDARLLQHAEEVGAAVVPDAGRRIQEWLLHQDLAAVVLRPDRYVFEACPTLEKAASSLLSLRDALA